MRIIECNYWDDERYVHKELLLDSDLGLCEILIWEWSDKYEKWKTL
jgi:hypothetical protein